MNVEAYKVKLEIEKYSKNTIKNWGYYAAKFEHDTINQAKIYQFIRDHNNKFARAFLKHYLTTINRPDLKIPALKGRTSSKEIEYLEKEEIDRIKEISSDKLRLIMALMFEAGLRISEVMLLQRKDIKFKIDGGKIIGGNVEGIGKGRKPFSQPITRFTAKELVFYCKDMKPLDFPFQWPNVKNQRHKALHELRKLIKVILGKDTHHPCHIFRHSCGTFLKYRGWDLRDIQVFLRHKNLQTVECYTAVKKDALLKSWDSIMNEAYKEQEGELSDELTGEKEKDIEEVVPMEKGKSEKKESKKEALKEEQEDFESDEEDGFGVAEDYEDEESEGEESENKEAEEPEEPEEPETPKEIKGGPEPEKKPENPEKSEITKVDIEKELKKVAEVPGQDDEIEDDWDVEDDEDDGFN